jgi:beta-galactosidase GanA
MALLGPYQRAELLQPLQIFKGNIPNGDAAEVSAWHKWLRDRYKDLSALADAWAQTPEELGSFDSIPLPSAADLTYARHGNPRQVRAVDYNLFAQDMFSVGCNPWLP